MKIHKYVNDSLHLHPHLFPRSADKTFRLQGVFIPILQVEGVISRLDRVQKREMSGPTTRDVRRGLVAPTRHIYRGVPEWWHEEWSTREDV